MTALPIRRRAARWACLVALALATLTGCQRAEPLPVLSHIEGVTLTDTTGAPFPLSKLSGEVWVAHFMFTRCEGPCPRMVAEFGALQKAIGPRDGLHWVSISADPTYDSPEVLAAYAKRFDADETRWHFLTGDAAAIYNLAEKSFLLPAEPVTEEGGLITHSSKMAVIDHRGDLRAYHSHFEETNAAALTAEIEALLSERP